MPYDGRDPRSQLATAPPPARAGGVCRPAQYFEFLQLEPDETSASGSRSWFVRSQNCCVVFSLAATGDPLVRDSQPDEYLVLLPPGSDAEVTAGGDRRAVEGGSIVVVPPGSSSVTLKAGDVVVRVFPTTADDLTSRCRNAALYDEPDANVTPFEPWPAATEGDAIRVYALADYQPEPGRFGRIVRCRSAMVNYFEPDDGPRDPSRLSPHHHDDFEQLSLQLDGDYVHHMRTPWTVNLDDWRDDEHRLCTSPAIAIIPPPLIHTTQAIGHMRHQLVDIFSPPRIDFSERPGWVRNADDYPMPAR